MIPEEKWKFVKKELERFQKRDSKLGKLCADLKINIDSPLFDSFIEAQISLLNTLAFLVEDNYSILQQYVFGENFGKSYEDLKAEIENNQMKHKETNNDSI